MHHISDAAGASARAPTESLTGPIPDRLAISLFAAPATTSTRPTRVEPTWPELVARLSAHDRRRTKDGRGWTGATYKPGTTRKNANVVEWSVAGADIEHVTLDDVQELAGHLERIGLAYVMYSTYGFEPEAPRVRFAIPLTKAVPAERYPDAWRRINAHLFEGKNDPHTKDASRMLYVPAAPEGAMTLVKAGDGLALDWELLPAAAPLGSVNNSTAAQGKNLGLSRDTLEFLSLGAPVGQQRGRLLKATRALLSSGKSVEDTVELVWQGLERSPIGDPVKPWTHEYVVSVVEDIVGREPTKLEEWPELDVIEERVTPPPKNGHTNGHVHETPPKPPSAPIDPEPPIDHKGQPPVGRMLTETGNAERLCDQHGRDLHFCHPWGQWLAWDGRRWRRDTTGTVRQWGKGVVRSIYAEAARIEDREIRAATAAFAKKSESAAGRAAMLKNAEVEPGIAIEPEQMDSDGFLLNVLNGTVDLRTGQLRPHDRRDTITKLAPVVFDPQADCPTFLGFLERVLPDPDVRAFVRRFTGYGMTGDTSEQCLAFLHGGGANGKSTLLTVLQAMLGDYARQTAPELLVSRGGDRHPTELADLFGARFVASVEVDEGKRLAETLVKQMTGGDRMKARFMRQDFFEWTPTHKLFLAANHRPEIRGTDYAIWRRMHLVPFTVTIPPAERDGKLPAKLAAELPGILNWAIAGCLDWQRNGLGIPQAVKDATDAYRAEQDILADFLAERCVIDPQAWAEAGSLYKAYTEWCDAGGLKPVTGTAFGTRLSERGHRVERRPVGAKRARVRLGLRLLGPNETPNPDGFAPPDGLGHDFPHGSYPGARESDIPENPSNPSGAPNPSGEDGQPPLVSCFGCGGMVDTDDLMCSACSEVTA